METVKTLTSRLRLAELNSGSVVDLSSSVTVFVGPNNSGKTQILREVAEFYQGNDQPRLVIGRVGFEYNESIEEIINWLQENSTNVQVQMLSGPSGNYESRLFMGENFGVYEHELKDRYLRGNKLHVFHMPPQILSAENRLSLTNFARSSDIDQQQPSTLENFALRDELQEELGSLTLQAFGFHTSVWTTGGGYRLVRGKPTASRNDWGAYQAQMKALPNVDEQGDGVRSFVGILVELLTGAHEIVTIDEPEAFLHPPQAKFLGRQIAKLRNRDRQIFLATHSSEILTGLISESSGRDISIVRLLRKGDVTYAHQMTAEDIESLSKDTLLRHANLMDGLFFDGVVVCEADRDSTYYEAVRETLGNRSFQKRDLYFTHALGGKARIAQAIEALRKTSVPCCCIVDFDLLRDTNDVFRLIRSFGQDPKTLQLVEPLNRIQQQVQKSTLSPRRSEIIGPIRPIVDSDERYVSDVELKALRNAGETRTGWSLVKAQGLNFFRGSVRNDVATVIESLESVGIFVVAIGELESFHPDLNPDRKDIWISEVLQQRLYAGSEDARSLLVSVEEFIEDSIILKTCSE